MLEQPHHITASLIRNTLRQRLKAEIRSFLTCILNDAHLGDTHPHLIVCKTTLAALDFAKQTALYTSSACFGMTGVA